MPEYIGMFKGRVSIAALFESGAGLVAGFRNSGEHQLHDSSGSVDIPKDVLATLDQDSSYWLALRFTSLQRAEVVFQQKSHPSKEVNGLRQRFDTDSKRWDIHRRIRDFFYRKGFLETDTPALVACPGMEPYLDSFPAGNGFLRTSPELHMKRLLAAGYDKIFQIGPCFRAGDIGSQHREEFLMLEWYRLFADLDALIEDLQEMFSDFSTMASDPDYFQKPFEQITCAELFKTHLQLHLEDHSNKLPLQSALLQKGIPFSVEDDWDTLYFLLFLNCIERNLGKERPTIVTHYPASQAALAKQAPVVEGNMPTCFRFELYIKGMECANAFYELTDPDIQRDRFEADRAERKILKKVVYPIDESFMSALSSGIPPAAGIALGVDRLVLALLSKTNLDEIMPF